MFGVDNFNTFWVIDYIKVLYDNKDDVNINNNKAITTAWLFLWKGQAKNYQTKLINGPCEWKRFCNKNTANLVLHYTLLNPWIQITNPESYAPVSTSIKAMTV